MTATLPAASKLTIGGMGVSTQPRGQVPNAPTQRDWMFYTLNSRRVPSLGRAVAPVLRPVVATDDWPGFR